MRVALLLGMGLLVAAQCSTGADLTQRVDQQASQLMAIQERVADLERQTGAISDLNQRLDTVQEQVEGIQTSLSKLAGKVETLGTEVEASHSEEAHASHEAPSTFDVAAAQYILDTAGFHGIDVALNETKKIDPAHLRTVRRVHRVLNSASWPEELRPQAADFLELLERFQEALEADDAESAAPLATEVHDAGHDLSHAIDGWLGEGGHGHDE